MSEGLDAYIEACRRRLDDLVAAGSLTGIDTALWPQLAGLDAAGRYCLDGGGKRIRPVLLYAAGDAVGDEDPGDAMDHLALAVELLHTYSLIHDDLPAMDDDDLRRGKPSLHRAYDEATAILVGDGLQARAFELIALAPALDAGRKLDMIAELGRAAGMAGMVGGQFIDIQATGADLALPELTTMHSLKTGALICASVRIGGLAGGGTADQLAALERYGVHIGLAFQVVDDILDVTADSAALGKTGGKDEAANKPTYTALLGLDGAREEADRLLGAALDALECFGESADVLRALARYVVARDR